MVDRQVLDSWKEIAAYLGRSVRTCQRLERDLDLPVHRLEETPKARVFAYQDEIDLWINRSKNSESEARSKLFGLKKILIPASAALFLIIMAVVIWKFLPQKETGTAVIPAPKTSVAVVYFKNNTGDENLEHWRRALCELLIYDLAQSRYIDILPADKLFDVMNQLGLADTSEYSAEELEQIADNAKIKNIIHGNFVKAGNKFRISASIRDFEEGRDVLLESSEGEGEESLFAVVDELTAKIKHELEFSSEQVAADVDRNVENITTSSPEALKYYSAGWNHRFRGNNIEAIRLMEKAIEIDPQFALAYRVLGTLYTSVGKPYLSNEYRIKAYELRDRVSDRERLLLEVLHLTSSESTRGRAIEAAKEFLEFYPDSDHPNNLLGAICWDTGKWKESLGYHESAFRISAHSVTWANLITACQASGYNKRAEKIYKDYQTIYSNNFRNAHLWMPEYHYLLMGEYDIAKSEAQKIFLIDPSFPSLPLFRADTFPSSRGFGRS